MLSYSFTHGKYDSSILFIYLFLSQYMDIYFKISFIIYLWQNWIFQGAYQETIYY